MNETLYPYQTEDAENLSTKRFCLVAHEMGTGKSAIAIRAADIIQAQRILIICPAIARINWQREFDKFSTVNRTFCTINHKNESPIDKHMSYIISYDLSVYYEPGIFGNFDLLILDEAHYLKSLTAKRAQKVLGTYGYIRKAKKCWALTGTPTPNHAAELWPWLYTIGCTKLNYNQFVEEYCTSKITSFGKQITGTNTFKIPQLKKLLEPVMLRRTQKEVLPQLPQISFSNLYVEPGEVDLELPSNWAAQYFTFNENGREELLDKLDKERKIIDGVCKLSLDAQGIKILEGLANSISTIRQYVGLQKVKPVVELVSEELMVGAYDKIVIFAVHQAVIEQLRRGLSEFGVVTLYGGTPPEKRQQHVDRFMHHKKTRVFIGNVQAAGTAITLTSCNQVMFVEQSWVPGDNVQAAKRCHRIGQERPVFVRCATVADSFDERISHTLRRKTKEISEIFDKELVTSNLSTPKFD